MEFDPEKYKVWKLPHPLLLHWVLNPGLAFNELVLGQRIPKVSLVDITSDAPLMERQYVPCPHCNYINDGRRWAGNQAFGHWFGYLCPECHGKIPCLWNFTSLILLAITFPLWIWFKPRIEAAWIEKEKSRLVDLSSVELPLASNTSWLRMGLGFGLLMFCFMTLPMVIQDQLTAREVGIEFIIWMIVGLMFGGTMKFFLGRRRK